VVQVVGSPVVAAGNSIGGFISASLAADYPQLCSGLVLINSAGARGRGVGLGGGGAWCLLPPWMRA
jgi:pimeloyl-ACP methyl ester carboxylesterase